MPPAALQSMMDPAPAPFRRRINRGATLTQGAVLLIAAALLAIGITVWDMRQDALEAARSTTDNLAIVLAEQTARSVQAVDIVVREMQDMISGLGPATPEDFRRILGTEQIHQYLRSRADRLPQVDVVALIGADGTRVNNSWDWPVVPADLSDRDYIRHFSAENDSHLFVSEPILNRATKAWTIIVGRRVNARDGRFIGVVSAAMPLQVFTGLYRIDRPAGERRSHAAAA